MRLPNFIIAGTEKAGTTSVFTYLGEHPRVCAASIKETDFFRNGWTGNQDLNRSRYAEFFSRCTSDARIVMEASPGYLGEAETVVPRMSSLLPDIRLLFILRDPVERLYSSYNFHVGRLNIDATIGFAEYAEKCRAFAENEKSAEQLGMDPWFLRVLEFGYYVRFLEPYFSAFPRHNIKIMFFEDLKSDPLAFILDLSQFLELDPDFWQSYQFRKSNVTFFAGNERLHRAAMYLNAKTEPLLRNNPAVKRALVSIYKKLNQRREGYDEMPPTVREQLQAHYRPHNVALRNLIGPEATASWVPPSILPGAGSGVTE